MDPKRLARSVKGRAGKTQRTVRHLKDLKSGADDIPVACFVGQAVMDEVHARVVFTPRQKEG